MKLEYFTREQLKSMSKNELVRLYLKAMCSVNSESNKYIEAIPVDWLLQQGKTAYASDTVEYIREAERYNKTITDLIDKWRSERKEE